MKRALQLLVDRLMPLLLSATAHPGAGAPDGEGHAHDTAGRTPILYRIVLSEKAGRSKRGNGPPPIRDRRFWGRGLSSAGTPASDSVWCPPPRPACGRSGQPHGGAAGVMRGDQRMCGDRSAVRQQQAAAQTVVLDEHCRAHSDRTSNSLGHHNLQPASCCRIRASRPGSGPSTAEGHELRPLLRTLVACAVTLIWVLRHLRCAGVAPHTARCPGTCPCGTMRTGTI